MKMKEVTDICHTDVRYKALKTAGERKQALAEYQVRYCTVRYFTVRYSTAQYDTFAFLFTRLNLLI